MVSKPRALNQVLWVQRGLSACGHEREKIAIYGAGLAELKEYQKSPHGKVTHVLLRKQDSHGYHRSAGLSQVDVQYLHDYGGVWNSLAERLGGPKQPLVRGQRMMADQIKSCLFRVEVALWKESALDQGHHEVCVLVLDHIQDPRNYGALIRTAGFFGVSHILVPQDRQSPITETVVHCSRGAMGYVKILQVVNLARALERLKSYGYWILGADMSGQSHEDLMGFYDKVGLVLGNEGKGLSVAIKRKCDRIVRIKGMTGGVESLNVSVAGGILIHSFGTRRQQGS